MSNDFNNINYPFFESQTGEGHLEPLNTGIKSNVKDEEHPLFSKTGIVDFINHGRSFANSYAEKTLTGKMTDENMDKLLKASRNLKFPIDLLYVALDWDKDMTSRSDFSDITTISKKMKDGISELRNTLSRDPNYGEIFAYYLTNSASKVKQIVDKASTNPEDQAEKLGTKKDDIIMYKKRNNSSKPRNNREVLDFFLKRVVNGRRSYVEYIRKDS